MSKQKQANAMVIIKTAQCIAALNNPGGKKSITTVVNIPQGSSVLKRGTNRCWKKYLTEISKILDISVIFTIKPTMNAPAI
jgi:hypothetical protein